MFLHHLRSPFWADFGFSTFFFLGMAFSTFLAPPMLDLSSNQAIKQSQLLDLKPQSIQTWAKPGSPFRKAPWGREF